MSRGKLIDYEPQIGIEYRGEKTLNEVRVEERLGAIAGLSGFALFLWFFLITQDLTYTIAGILFLIAMVVSIYALRTKRTVTEEGIQHRASVYF